MTVDISIFLVGLLLLWFPRQWMRRGFAFLRRRRRSAESRRTEPWKNTEPGDPRVSFATEFSKFRNYLDLLRGAAGSLMLWGGLGMPSAVTVLPGAGRNVFLQLMALRAIVLLIGVLIQAVRYEKNHVSFYPPIFYLAGVSVALCDARVAAFAFVLIWALNITLPNAQGFLTAYAAILVVFGYFFKGLDVSVMYAGFLIFMPVLLSLLAKRQLIVFTRRGTRAPMQT